jgi:hypothetical protein
VLVRKPSRIQMSQSPETNSPQIILKADPVLGLFAHIPEADFTAEEVRDGLAEDQVSFSFNPPEAAHLAQPGMATFVFGRGHPRFFAGELELCDLNVVIDSDVVITEDLYQPPVKQLLSLGEPRRNEKRDYAALGISSHDVAALIQMAADEQLHTGPPDSPVVWAPVHAWRALAAFRAEAAIAPLVELLHRADNEFDEWVNGDLPETLAQFGPVVLAPLTDYLADAAHGEWARTAAAKAISLVGETHPDMRLDCISRIAAQLDCFAAQSETLNGFLISALWDIRAVEAMPVIERAFASGRVDESIVGDVEDVQIEFGLKTQREHPRKPNRITELSANLRAAELLESAEANRDFEPAPIPYLAPPKVGRNEPCPCGSGKKFKKCCGG